jgi:site-specific DNA-methyltransferase (adenine-specific)
MRKETIGQATLYLGDCLTVLPTLGKVDAVITDPPYGVSFQYASHEDDPAEFQAWRDKWFAAFTALDPSAMAIACGMRHIASWPQPKWVICWHKPASMGRGAVGFNNWEPVLFYGKAAKPSVDFFVAPIVVDDGLYGHPCPKPLRWATNLVTMCSEDDAIVLDPFMGSGTTGVACAQLGRRFVGVEVEEKYFDIACRRIEDSLRQERLFA